jgi:hypothetical protein
MPAKRKMSAPEFEAVRPLLPNIAPARIEAARAVLVEGKTLQAVADAHGWKARQTVSDCVNVVCEAHARWMQSQEAAAQFQAPPLATTAETPAPESLIKTQQRANVARVKPRHQ